ncbi:MAG: ribosomal protein S18 acetylase RimI-like enzyme, partial [Kiritimatiellia bacterium]
AKEFLAERIHAADSIIFYALNENKAYVGFVQLYPSFSSVSAKKIWILNDLFVSEAARKLGVATALLNYAKAFSVRAHAKGLALATEKTNSQAQALYQSLGYERDNEFYHYFLKTPNV